MSETKNTYDIRSEEFCEALQLKREQSINEQYDKEQYDANCKNLLAEKIFLARILKSCIQNYRLFSPEEIAARFIEGDPQISEIPVFPDPPRIIGDNTEDKSETEGTVYFDIRFTAKMPDAKGELTSINVNLEGQKEPDAAYPLIMRGIYYDSRMISSQHGTVFIKSHYEKIQKVYSIWISMNEPEENSNTISNYAFEEQALYGNYKEDPDYYDLMHVQIIRLGDMDQAKDNELLRMLDIMFTSGLEAHEKRRLLEEEFGIPITERMEERLENMSGFGAVLEAKAYKKGQSNGIEQGRELGIELAKTVLKDYADGKSVDVIAESRNISEEEVRKIID